MQYTVPNEKERNKSQKKKIKLNVFSDLKICGFLATKFTHVYYFRRD